MYRVNTNDAKQREWFVFDNRLVLPEYLIEFDLITQATREEEEGSTGEIKSKKMRTRMLKKVMAITKQKYQQLFSTSNRSG